MDWIRSMVYSLGAGTADPMFTAIGIYLNAGETFTLSCEYRAKDHEEAISFAPPRLKELQRASVALMGDGGEEEPLDEPVRILVVAVETAEPVSPQMASLCRAVVVADLEGRNIDE